MKKCNKCKQDKPLSEFGVCRSRSDGLQAKCIICNREQAKAYYHATKQKDRHGKRAASRQKRIAEALNAIKTSAGCRFCDERCSVCLDMHHIDGEDKEFILARCVYALPKILAEAEKCEVLCSNCHRKVHAGLLIVEDPRRLDLGPLESLANRTRGYVRLTSTSCSGTAPRS